LIVLPRFAAVAGAQVGGSLSGTVKDSTGGVIPGATVSLMNTAIGAQLNSVTDAQGHYSFPNVSVGRYDLTVTLEGFKPVKRAGLAVDADSRLQIDAMLEIGELTDTVTVVENAIHVETASTQLGEVVQAVKMTALSLNGRSYTDLLPIQPGVIPITTIQANSVIMAGVTGTVAPSGGLNAGNVSVSGARETANGFLVNGADVQEHMNGGTEVVPNLDSIEEFRVLTNNFDPQYGNYNGGIINVVTKAGSDRFHGNLFEFFRNTRLDARNYFSPERAAFSQNQPGGTVGGPLKRGKIFFFADYQATRTTQGIETGLIPVPSAQERTGNFSDKADSLTGAVNGEFWANILSQRLGYHVSPGESYYAPGCTSASQCVFPNAAIPSRAFSPVAQRLMKYIPAPNSGDGQFSTGAFAQTVRDDKVAGRVDANTRLGLLTGYYFFDDYNLDNPYPGQQGGANVPGFDARTLGRAQLFEFGDNTVFGSNTVNELHVGFTRNANDVGKPNGGLGVSLASQGFVTGPGTPGIVVLAPQLEGVENIAFDTFTMGVTVTGVNQTNSTLNITDNLSKVVGAHTVKMGGQFQFGQVRLEPNATFNGTFSFAGTETGSDFADFLIGIPSNYIQSSGGIFYLRNKYGGLFAQDSWRPGSKLTINYGLRWDIIAPWYERNNQIQTIVPGQQSVVYPGAPTGLVFPTDPGIARGLSPAQFGSISPRVGAAYSPDDRTSIRGSVGRFYTAFQGLSAGIMYGVPPYGYNYLSPAPPIFETPFITAADGTNNGQRFPLAPPPLDASASNSSTAINWPNYLPVNADPFFSSKNQVPYSDNFMVSIERELAPNTVATASYVGSRGHHMVVIRQANPGNPALCLSVSDPSQVAPGSPTCGPFAENGVFTTSSGQVIHSTRTTLGPNYGTMTSQDTTGYSRYNALELNVRYGRANGNVSIGYTYSKSVDVASNLGEQVNPFDITATEAPSAFDLRHNFVASYTYELPLEHLFGRVNTLTQGWSISGTSRFSSGFPVTLYNNADTSLLGTFGNGVNNNLLDTPNFTPGDLQINHVPAKGPAFNTSLFSLPSLGQLGTAPRRFFYGPGIENTDLSLLKNISMGQSRTLQVRLEAFNVFNHPQFYGPGAVNGNITSATFGQIVNAAPPRLVQLGAKFSF
jgi:hypothetical protein